MEQARLKMVLLPLNEKDNVFKNVDVLNAGNDGNTAKDATKVGDDTDSDFEDVYDEAAR
ncbi:hypothetical protein Tco_1571972, partial [Tanacetum coccineum]